MATSTSCENQAYKCQGTVTYQNLDNWTQAPLFDSEILRNLQKLRFPQLDDNYQ